MIGRAGSQSHGVTQSRTGLNDLTFLYLLPRLVFISLELLMGFADDRRS